MTVFLRVALGVLGLAASVDLASAQQAAQPADLPPVEVTAKKASSGKKKAVAKQVAPKAAPKQSPVPASEDAPVVGSGRSNPSLSATGPVDGYVANNTGFGTKTNTPINLVPQAVSVIGRSEIDDQGAQKTDEALRYTAGVFAQPFGADSDTNWLFIRGFQATQSGIFQNGLPLYSYGFGGFYVDSFGLERIEVLKGASSVLYGGSNPGGLVNYVSKAPNGERVRLLESGITNYGNAYAGFDIGDRASNAVSYRVTGRVAGGDGYTDFAEGFRGFIDPSIRWSDSRTSMTVLASYGHIDETHGGGSFLPYVGTVEPGPFGRISRRFNYTEPDIDAYNREQGSVGYEFEHKFSEQFSFRQNARYGASHVDEQALYPYKYRNYDPSTGLLERINFAHDTDVETFLIDNQLEARAVTGPVRHTLLFGADYKYFNIDQVQGASNSVFAGVTPINPFDPSYGASQERPAVYLNQEITQQQFGIYLQDQMRFGDGWIVTLNGRYDWVDTDGENMPTDSIFSSVGPLKGQDKSASGRAGIGYEFANGLTPYVSVASFFNPVLGTTGFSNLNLFEPETGQQYEAGLKYRPTFMDALFTMAVFDLTRQNVVGPTLLGVSNQTGEITSKGIELEARVNVTPDFRVTGAFTAYDLEVTKGVYQYPFDVAPPLASSIVDISGNRPFIVPEIMASASFDYTFRQNMLQGFSIGGGVRYIGSSPADSLNLYWVPDVTLFDAKIGYAWNGWGIDLNVTNLLDENYVASCQEIYACSYGEGRVVKLKTHVTW